MGQTQQPRTAAPSNRRKHPESARSHSFQAAECMWPLSPQPQRSGKHFSCGPLWYDWATGNGARNREGSLGCKNSVSSRNTSCLDWTRRLRDGFINFGTSATAWSSSASALAGSPHKTQIARIFIACDEARSLATGYFARASTLSAPTARSRLER